MLYNDGYRTLLGSSKHPQAWGCPVREVWPEVWDVIGPMLAGVASGGPATWVEDELLVVDRNGYLEEAYFTWSYGAVHDETGAVAGILNVATETSAKVLAERRPTCPPDSSPPWPTPRTREDVRRRCARRARAPTTTTTSRATSGGPRRADPAPAAVDDEGRTVHVVPVVEPGRRRAHRAPAADREPPSAVGPDAPGLRRDVRLPRRHGPERHPAPRGGAPPDRGPDRARRRQVRLLRQRQPRAAHAAHPHRRPGAGRPRRRAASTPSSASASS